MWKSLNFGVFLFLMFSCGEKQKAQIPAERYIPELLLKDSLVIDRLTELSLLDVKSSTIEYLMYDWNTKEIMRVDSQGEILAIADLVSDGKNSFRRSYFINANYGAQDEVVIQTDLAIFRYDLDFNLKENQNTDYELVTRRVGGSRSFQTLGDFIFTFSYEAKDSESYGEDDNSLSTYPLLNLRHAKSLEIIYQSTVPASSQMVKSPGIYYQLDPIVHLKDDLLYALFPNSPEIYIYKFPELELINQWDFNPGETYQQIKPAKKGEDLSGFFNSLAASEYQYFVFSNGYLLTMLEDAAPKVDVDALPKEMIGDEFITLSKKYKNKYTYQIFNGGEKLWQGRWDIQLKSVRDLLFATEKVGIKAGEVELDVQTFYFYELK